MGRSGRLFGFSVADVGLYDGLLMKHNVDDHCGCAMGAVFMVAGLLVASVYYGWEFRANGLPFSSAAIRVFVATLVAASVGKVVGISRNRWRRTRSFAITKEP
jgi:hypothetical protein